MRKVLLTFIAIISFSTIAMAQFRIGKAPERAPTPEAEPISYVEVVEVPDVSKDDLYDRAKKWIQSEYGISTDVLQLDDKEAGDIVARGAFEYFQNHGALFGWNCKITYIVSIAVKDGKYRCEITDFYHTGTWDANADVSPLNLGLIKTIEPQPTTNIGKKHYKKGYELALNKIDEKVFNLAASLKTAMSMTNQKQPKDW